MKYMKKIVIVGGGASGLVCAIKAKSKNNNVILLEKNNKCGKKILASGSGKCNYFNDDMDLKHFHSNSNNINKIITNDNIKEMLNFLDKIGIKSKIKNGYYYPSSNSSTSVKNALVTEALVKGVKIIKNIDIKDIIKNDKFIINPEKENITADCVVLSTGSMASIGYDSYFLAKKFGHTIIKPTPALVKLNSSKNLKGFEKIRCDAIVSLYENGKLIKSENGQLQFTNTGISGVCVFNLSQYIKLNNCEYICVNFVPFLDNISAYLESKNNKTIFQVLETILNYKVVNVILKECNINKGTFYNELKVKEKEKLLKNLLSFKIPITGLGDFKEAQVCKGGVCLNEINPLNMRSLKEDNLYLTGELLDVNGDCGGYNLTFAFISGMLAGRDIK